MNSRRQFLGAAATGGLGVLAGCSFLSGAESGAYPAGVPADSAFPNHSITRAARFDVATLRNHVDRFHPECGDVPVGCTLLQYDDIVAQGGFVLDLEEVDAIVGGGRREGNAHQRTLASLRGAYLFKIYEYNVEASTLESRLTDHFTAGSSSGNFQLYREDTGGAVLADDGNRLVVGLDGVTQVVAERLAGQHETFVSATDGVATVRNELGSTTAEYVGVPYAPSGDLAVEQADRVAIGEGVDVGSSGVTYRSVTVYSSADELSAVSDEAVRAWANEKFQPARISGVESVPGFEINRNGRVLVVSGSPEQYTGLY